MLNYRLIVLLLFPFILICVGCGGDSNGNESSPKENPLIGMWYAVSFNVGGVTYEDGFNGTHLLDILFDEKNYIEKYDDGEIIEVGKYTFSGDIIKFTPFGSDYYHEEQFDIEGSTLTLHDSYTGNLYTYEKGPNTDTSTDADANGDWRVSISGDWQGTCDMSITDNAASFSNLNITSDNWRANIVQETNAESVKLIDNVLVIMWDLQVPADGTLVRQRWIIIWSLEGMTNSTMEGTYKHISDLTGESGGVITATR